MPCQSCESGTTHASHDFIHAIITRRPSGSSVHHMEKGRRLLQDYDAVMDKVAEAEELSADHRPSTLEKLAELASDTSAPKSSARSAPEL